MTIAVYEAIFESARAKWKWSSHNLCPPHPLQKEIFFFSGSQLISQQQSHVSAIRTVSLSYMSTMSNKKSVGSISSVSVPVMLVKCVSHEKNILLHQSITWFRCQPQTIIITTVARQTSYHFKKIKNETGTLCLWPTPESETIISICPWDELQYQYNFHE
jgi:hypothetical protein